MTTDDVKILEDKEDPDKGKPSSKWVAYVIEGGIILLALAFGLLIRFGVYETAIVTSGSMEPTILKDDRVLIDHRKKLSGKWKRGDIVMFETPETWDDVPDTLMKRVVALPGERVQVYNGKVYIGRDALDEDYLKETPQPENHAPVLLQKNEYYVLGDNRNNSDDSRDHGPIPNDAIRGRAVMQLTPLGKMGKFEKPSY